MDAARPRKGFQFFDGQRGSRKDQQSPKFRGDCGAANIYRPAENGKVVEGKFPVILERTPYGKDNDVYYANYCVKQGYVVILQDGRAGSIRKVSGDFSATILTTATTLPSGLAPSPGPTVSLGP
jgi:hypothetical protein